MTKITIRGSRTADTVKIEIDGKELTCCSKLVIDPIERDGLITAQMTVLVDELDFTLYNALLLRETEHEPTT